MKNIKLIATLCFLLMALLSCHKSTSEYVEKKIEGWKVIVNKTLINDHSTLYAEVEKILKIKLYNIKQKVPAPAVKKIQTIPIWLEYFHPQHKAGCFHPSKDWLIENGMNPDKAESVEFSNATNFLKYSKYQPWMVLHELAHGYHHIYLKDFWLDIEALYEKAKASPKYKSVLHYNGKKYKHYAMKKEEEYFAEATEAYFGTNDFYPFTRSELKKYDPDLYDLLEKLWSK
jgi:hypothetical protein